MAILVRRAQDVLCQETQLEHDPERSIQILRRAIEHLVKCVQEAGVGEAELVGDEPGSALGRVLGEPGIRGHGPHATGVEVDRGTRVGVTLGSRRVRHEAIPVPQLGEPVVVRELTFPVKRALLGPLAFLDDEGESCPGAGHVDDP